MKQLTRSKGFKNRLAWKPDLSVIRLPEPDTVALSAMDIPYIRPRLLVKERDRVKIGTPLFCDKRNDCIVYVSPGNGYVKKIVFGSRRKLIEVIIRLDKTADPDPENEAVRFDPVTEEQLGSLPKQDLIKQLQQGGLWQCFRQFPSRDTADGTHTPSMIIVSLNGNDLFSPDPSRLLEHREAYFEFGLAILNQLTDKVIVTSRKESMGRLGEIKKHVTHQVPDIYPAWDPGAVLYQVKESVEDNTSWTISAEHLVLAAKFLVTGKYPIERMFTVTRPDDKKPHIITRQGVPVKALAGEIKKEAVVTSGRFNGRIVDPNSHMGFFESCLNIIHPSKPESLFGFARPGFKTPSVSHTFVSSLIDSPHEQDCNLHGEERACINCGYCARICPVDLMPNFIMKALHSDDIEDALDLGLLDCCKCGLCSYTCPSKIELTHILSQGMDAHFKDTNPI